MKKKVIAIHKVNFCEIVEFEGSCHEKPDVMQIGKGQSFQMRLQVGSELDTETGEWSGLVEFVQQEPVKEGAFAQAWNPVPPVDPQVLEAEAKAKELLEKERAEAEAKVAEKGFIVP